VAQKDLCILGGYFRARSSIDDRFSFCAVLHVLRLIMTAKYLMRAGVVIIVALISWAVYVSSKQLSRNQRIEDEVSALQEEANKISRENETLTEKIRYFDSNDFREQEAKEKLGMKKAGEEVVVIKSWQQDEEEASPIDTKAASLEQIDEQSPNYKKWWHLFFSEL
jgi:cell division protein FtsB